MKTKLFLILTCFYLVSIKYYVFGVLKQKVTSFEDCDIPPDRYDKENFVNHTFLTTIHHGKTYLSVNFTINKNTPPVIYHLRGFGIRDKEKRKDFDIDKLTCRHPVTAAILKKLNIVYETANCTGVPGTYSIPRLNMDDFGRYYQYTVQGYSSYILELELSSSKGVMICVAITINLGVK